MAKKRAIANENPDIEQLSLFNAIANSNQKNGSCVPPTSATHEPTHEPTHEHIQQWVQEYYVTGRGKKHKYYRFCYLEDVREIGSCVRVHLPGGNITSPKALALKEKVENAIALGMSARAIVQIIKSRATR